MLRSAPAAVAVLVTTATLAQAWDLDRTSCIRILTAAEATCNEVGVSFYRLSGDSLGGSTPHAELNSIDNAIRAAGEQATSLLEPLVVPQQRPLRPLAATEVIEVPRYTFTIDEGRRPCDRAGPHPDSPGQARSEAVAAAGRMLRDLDGWLWTRPE